MSEGLIARYNAVQSDKKSDFLRELLLKDNDLLKQFFRFVQGEDLATINRVDIDELRDELWSEIDFIDPHELVSSCAYQYDYHGNEELTGEAVLNDIISPVYQQIENYFEKSDPTNAFRVMLSIYELLLVDLPDVDDSDFYIFGEGLETLLSGLIHYAYLPRFHKELGAHSLSIGEKEEIITVVFQRFSLYDNTKLFSDLSDLLIDLIDTQDMAYHLLERSKRNDLITLHTARILLKCAETLDDDDYFLEVANEFFKDDSTIAMKLLEKYKAIGEGRSFNRVSETLLKGDKRYFYALYIIENIDKEQHVGSYIEALKVYIDYKHSIPHYHLLRDHLDDLQKRDLIDQYRHSGLFYVKLLAIEKEHQKILEHVRTGIHFDLGESLKPIASVYPQEVYKIVEAYCEKELSSRTKNRKSYQRITKMLRSIIEYDETKTMVRSYANRLYRDHKNLRALRDELERSGLL